MYPHKANIERFFSLMQAQWIKERNMLKVESLRGDLFLQYNFEGIYIEICLPS
jgi:hypothetical protein